MLQSTDSVRRKIEKIISNDFKNSITFHNMEKPNIIFNNVVFGFDHIIFNNEGFIIPYGSKVLVKGPSGSGKTTLLNLIQGCIAPQKGKVLINNIRTLEVSSNPNIITRIYQNIHYFDMNLRGKILLIDEATNSVDAETSALIRTVFSEFEGTVLEVAHNYRKELDRYYTHVIEIKDGTIRLSELNTKN